MNPTEFQDQDQDENHVSSVSARATAASQSTWTSVSGNIYLSIAQISIGVFAKS